MAKYNEKPFNPIDPESLGKLRAALASGEKQAGKEGPPSIAGGDGKEKTPAAKPEKIQEPDREKQKKFGPSRASLWSAAVRKGAREKGGELKFTTKGSGEIIDKARQEMEADFAERAEGAGAEAEAAAKAGAEAEAAKPPAVDKEKAGVKPAAPRKERPKRKEPDAGREEKIGETMTSFENLYGDFYGKWAAKGKLAPELDPAIKELETEARKLGIKRVEIDKIREQAMRKTGYFDLLPREKPEEPEKPAEQAPKPAAKKKEGSRTESAAAAEETELEKWQREQASAAAQLAGLEREAPRIAAEERAKEEFAEYQREMKKGLEETAETARREREGAARHERLEQTRAAFVKAEQNWEKYLGLTGVLRGWFGRKAEVKKELDAAKETYEKARAEVVAGTIETYLREQHAFEDERIRAATEGKKGLWEKASKAWKLLGEQNLETWAGWKPQGRFGRIIARGVNGRLAIGAGLMGMAVWAGPGSVVALGAIGARRAMAGVGATIFSSEWLNRRAEAWKTTLKSEKIAAMSIEEIRERLGDAMVWLKFHGKLPSESEDFGKIQERYEELLRGEYQQAGNQEEYLRRQASELINSFGQRAERAAWMRDGRRAAAAAAGVGAAIGAAPLLRWLYGAQELKEAAVTSGPPPSAAPEVSGPEYAATIQGAEQAIAGGVTERLPAAFEIMVQYGEGPIHEARKAIAEYIALYGDDKLKNFTKAQRILAEEKLYRAVKDTLPEWKVGAKISFPRSAMEKVLDEIKSEAPERVAALDKNLAPFVEKVRWPRYQVEVFEEGGERRLYKPWEWDEGIRKVAKGLKAAEEVTPPAPEAVAAETPRYVPFDPAEEAPSYGPSLEDVETPAKAGEPIVAEAEEEVGVEELAVSKEEREEALKALEAAKEAAAEKLGLQISRLDPEEYNAIKNLKVSEALKKTYWGASEEARWPSSREPNHIDLWRKGKLRDGIAYVLEHLSMQDREKAVGLTIRQFIKEYYLR